MWILVPLLLVAGCDSDPPAPPRAVVDEERPCELATTAEVAAAVRGREIPATPVEARSSMDKSGTLLCNYPVGPPYSSVTLHVEEDVSEDEFRQRMERDPLNADPLDGAGDLAFTHAGVSVSVWEDGRTASASVQHFEGSDDTRRALEELAELIDSKL